MLAPLEINRHVIVNIYYVINSILQYLENEYLVYKNIYKLVLKDETKIILLQSKGDTFANVERNLLRQVSKTDNTTRDVYIWGWLD